MVAEFISRQSGSPINGETPCLNASGSGMQASHTMAHEALGPLPGMAHPSHHAPPQQQQQQPQQQQPQQQQQQQSQHGQSLQQQLDNGQAASGELYGQGGASNGSTSSCGSQSSYELRKELFSQRKQREFIPDNKKDDSYWDRRRRNNEAAKRSREKRRFNDMVLEQRVMELSKENHILKAQLEAIRDKYNICVDSVISPEHVLAALPSEPSLVKRAKLQSSAAAAAAAAALLYARSPSPVHTSVIHQPVSGARSARSPGQLYATAQSPHEALGQPTQQPLHRQPSPPQPQHQQHQHQPPHQQHQQSHQSHQSHQPHQQHQPPPQPQPHQQPQPCYGGPAEVEAGFQYPHFSQPHPAAVLGFEGGAAALNLSARSRSRERASHSPAFSQHELELSSSAGSGDEGHGLGLAGLGTRGPLASAAAAAAALALQLVPGVGGPNSGLPHKLRHKSRLGDKDAASALLALQGIKQEPNAARASPPWDNEGSSDERDSGISLGAEWPPSGPTGATHAQLLGQPQHAGLPLPESEREVKSRLDRLASEVASLQSILRLSKVGVGVGEALAAAAPTRI